jgi:WD40 repeat protein
VIGIDTYTDGIPQLRTAVNDARRLGTLLTEAHGYQVTALLDGDATAARLTQLLTVDLPALVQPDDRVLFYFAGHGVARDGDEGPNGYLLPADARRGDDSTYLHMPLVHDALLALPCRHMLVVLDSCFSGAFRWSGTRDIMEEFDVVHQEKYDRFVRDPAWQVITSASQDQKAIDQLTAGALGTRASNGEHSPFAAALFDAISGKGDLIPTQGGDGLVTATELYLYLEESLQEAASSVGTSQTPRLWPLKKHDKGEFVFFVPGRELTLPPAPELTFERNPWFGLASYDAGNSALFFGRDAEIATLRERIGVHPLTVVLGASGTGKSSLVKAGAMPRLQADGWHVLPVMRPGSTPMASLAQVLSAADSPAVAATADAIAARVRQVVTQHAPRPVLLVIDQFEELITLARSADERTAVLSLLAALAREYPDALRLVVTIRTDFEPNFDRTAFGDLWTAGRYVIPPMSRENMRRVIEQPATARVLYFEPSQLVDTLLDEVVATPGALPLLSFALSEMYIAFVKRQGGDRAITRADYDALGGVAGALRARAESEYAALDDAHRATLRRVMLRLVTSDGGGIARRRATDAELTFANPAEQQRADHVVQRLTAARLLVEGREADGESFVEPAHDALVRGWGRLLEWVRDEGNAPFPLLQQQRLARAAEEWSRSGTGALREGLLWRDSARSAQLAPLVRQGAPWLNTRELTFAKRSIRGRRITRLTAAAAVLLIAFGGIAATIAGLRATRRAEQVRIASIVRTAQSLTTDEPLLAALLLGSIDSTMVATIDDASRLAIIGTALQLDRAPQVRRSYTGRSVVTDAVLSRDAAWTVTSDADGRAWLRNLTTGSVRSLLADSAAGVTALAIDASTQWVATGRFDGVVHLFAVRDSLAPPVIIQSVNASIRLLAFSLDGQQLLVTDELGDLRVYDIAAARAAPVRPRDGTSAPRPDDRALRWRASDVQYTVSIAGQRVVTRYAGGKLRVHAADGRSTPLPVFSRPEAVTAMAASRDGRRVAVGGDSGSLRVIDVGEALRVRTLPPAARTIAAVEWSPDGTQLVSAGDDSVVRLWDAVALRQQREFVRPNEPMDMLTFSDDGRHFMATSSRTFRAVVFDTAGSAATLAGHTNEILAAGITADGERYVTVARDGFTWVWFPATPLHRGLIPAGAVDPSGSNVTSAAFTGDSRTLALASRDGWLYRYRFDSLTSSEPFATDIGPLRALEWHADGSTLYGLGADGRRLQFLFGRGAPVRRETEDPSGKYLTRAITAHDRRHALAFTLFGDATVWDITDTTTPARFSMIPPENACPDDGTAAPGATCLPLHEACAALSGNGALLAMCTTDGAVLLHRLDTRHAPPRRYPVTNGSPAALALSNDATLLAASVGLGDVWLWRTNTPADSGRVMHLGDLQYRQLVFSPDGRRLMTIDEDNWVRVVELQTATEVLAVRPRGRTVEVRRFTPDGRFVLTVGEGESEARLWNLDGSGGSLTLDARGDSTSVVEVSPDSRWVLIGNDRQTAYLHPLDVNLALTPLRAIAICLTAAQRQGYLLETATVARDTAEACAAGAVMQQGTGPLR